MQIHVSEFTSHRLAAVGLLCDPIWHVTSRSSVAVFHCELLYPYTFFYFFTTVFLLIVVTRENL